MCLWDSMKLPCRKGGNTGGLEWRGRISKKVHVGGGQPLTFFFVNLAQWWGSPAFSVVSEAECSEPHFPAAISRRHENPYAAPSGEPRPQYSGTGYQCLV
jgi:hypothetical protein